MTDKEVFEAEVTKLNEILSFSFDLTKNPQGQYRCQYTLALYALFHRGMEHAIDKIVRRMPK